MDERWNQIDNPEAKAQRDAIIREAEEATFVKFPGWDVNHPDYRAWRDWDNKQDRARRVRQYEEVLGKRTLIEQFAAMCAQHKLAGEELERFAQEHDIPGVCGYDSVHCWVENDIVGNALQWAASNHNC